MKIEQSIVINRPIEDVFAYVVDLNRAAEWTSGLIDAGQTSEGPIGVGTTYRYTAKLASQKLQTEGEVTEYEPNRQYSWKATSSPFPMHGGFTIESVEGGAKVTQTVEGEPGGFFKLAAPLLDRMTRQQTEESLSNLKDVLEAGA